MRELPYTTPWDHGTSKNQDGTQVHRHYGLLHRLDGPAVEFEDGSQKWCYYGLKHRLDGPAMLFKGFGESWYVAGLRHCDSGPAIRRWDGYHEYWLRGVKHTKETWLETVLADEELVTEEREALRALCETWDATPREFLAVVRILTTPQCALASSEV